MLLVTAYPILYAIWLSLHRYDLRFPEQSRFIGLANYASVLSSEVWWQALTNTVIITICSVTVELVLGFALALLMFKATLGRRTIRTVILIPYAMITVVSALAWKFAFDPTTGFVNALLNLDQAWLTERWSAFFVIIFTEIWKTTPFMALLLLAGLTLIPQDLLKAARVDGATAWQRFIHITLPLMKPTIGVALLFRTLDAFRIFDTVYVQTRGAAGTETVSMVGYNVLIARLNLGLGSAVSVLIFIAMLIIALLLIKGFGAPLSQTRGQ
ncbi:MAG: sugar ABC transporter permease [Methylobacter sp.]|nr:sugar ABC transporter permease [Methylobacter sp.]